MVEVCQSLSRTTTVGSILTGHTYTLKAGKTMSGATTVDGVAVRCVQPLYSGLLGAGAEQYCPCVDGIRVKLTLATSSVGIPKSHFTKRDPSREAHIIYIRLNPHQTYQTDTTPCRRHRHPPLSYTNAVGLTQIRKIQRSSRRHFLVGK